MDPAPNPSQAPMQTDQPMEHAPVPPLPCKPDPEPVSKPETTSSSSKGPEQVMGWPAMEPFSMFSSQSQCMDVRSLTAQALSQLQKASQMVDQDPRSAHSLLTQAATAAAVAAAAAAMSSAGGVPQPWGNMAHQQQQQQQRAMMAAGPFRPGLMPWLHPRTAATAAAMGGNHGTSQPPNPAMFGLPGGMGGAMGGPMGNPMGGPLSGPMGGPMGPMFPMPHPTMPLDIGLAPTMSWGMPTAGMHAACQPNMPAAWAGTPPGNTHASGSLVSHASGAPSSGNLRPPEPSVAQPVGVRALSMAAGSALVGSAPAACPVPWPPWQQPFSTSPSIRPPQGKQQPLHPSAGRPGVGQSRMASSGGGLQQQQKQQQPGMVTHGAWPGSGAAGDMSVFQGFSATIQTSSGLQQQQTQQAQQQQQQQHAVLQPVAQAAHGRSSRSNATTGGLGGVGASVEAGGGRIAGGGSGVLGRRSSASMLSALAPAVPEARTYRFVAQAANCTWRAQVGHTEAGQPAKKYYGAPRRTAEEAARDADKLLYKLRGPTCPLNMSLSPQEASRLEALSVEELLQELHTGAHAAMQPPACSSPLASGSSALDAASALMFMSRDQQCCELHAAACGARHSPGHKGTPSADGGVDAAGHGGHRWPSAGGGADVAVHGGNRWPGAGADADAHGGHKWPSAGGGGVGAHNGQHEECGRDEQEEEEDDDGDGTVWVADMDGSNSQGGGDDVGHNTAGLHPRQSVDDMVCSDDAADDCSPSPGVSGGGMHTAHMGGSSRGAHVGVTPHEFRRKRSCGNLHTLGRVASQPTLQALLVPPGGDGGGSGAGASGSKVGSQPLPPVGRRSSMDCDASCAVMPNQPAGLNLAGPCTSGFSPPMLEHHLQPNHDKFAIRQQPQGHPPHPFAFSHTSLGLHHEAAHAMPTQQHQPHHQQQPHHQHQQYTAPGAAAAATQLLGCAGPREGNLGLPAGPWMSGNLTCGPGLCSTPPDRHRSTPGTHTDSERMHTPPGAAGGGSSSGNSGPLARPPVASTTPSDRPPFRYIVKIGSRWRAQVGQVDGGVQRKYYGPYLDDPASAARDADKILYKLRGAGAVTNLPLPPEVKAKLDGMTLSQLLQSFKTPGANAAWAAMPVPVHAQGMVAHVG